MLGPNGEIAVCNHVVQVNLGPYYVQQVPTVTLAGNGTGSVTFTINCDDFLWCFAIASSTSPNFYTRIKVENEGNYLDNGQTPGQLFWGTAANPNKIPPKALDVNTQITFELQDFSASTNAIDISMAGFLLPDDPQQRAAIKAMYGKGRGLMLYNIPTAGLVLAQNVPGSYSVQVETWRNFRLTQITGSTSGTATKGRFSYKDVRKRGILSLAQNRIPFLSLVGTVSAPARIPSTIIAEKQSTIDLDFLDTAGAATVKLLFQGAREPDDYVFGDPVKIG